MTHALTVHRVPCLADNYAWLVVDETTSQAAIVDPSEAKPVIAAAEAHGAVLTAIWNTHHHWDHVGGNEELIQRQPNLRVYGGKVDETRIPGLTDTLEDGDEFTFGEHTVSVIFVPGHTRGHIAYVTSGYLFCGDTLFAAGCGRLFEGTPAQMVDSLGKLRALPDDTQVCCGHEYTRANLRFAKVVDPENGAVLDRIAKTSADQKPTVPFSLGEDKQSNPFLRWDTPGVEKSAGTQGDVDVFAWVRAAKDRF